MQPEGATPGLDDAGVLERLPSKAGPAGGVPYQRGLCASLSRFSAAAEGGCVWGGGTGHVAFQLSPGMHTTPGATFRCRWLGAEQLAWGGGLLPSSMGFRGWECWSYGLVQTRG